MSENYARSALRVSVAQICQVLGWDAVQLSACDLLSDVLDRYIQQLARSCHRYAELYGRTDPVLSDIGRAFGLLGVNLSELEDFVNHLEPVSFPQTTHLFPVAKSSTLQFPSPGEERRDYIPDYLPPLVSLQEDEEEEPVPVAMGTSAEAMQVSVEEDDGEEDYDEEAENAENRPAKREADEAFPLGVMPTAKRPRLGPSLNPDSSPEWTSEPREPLSSLNPQMPPSPTSSSPPLSPAPTPAGAMTTMMSSRPPVTPGRKPPRPSIASPGRKSKSPRRGGSNASPGRGTPKLNQKEKKKKNSPRSPRGGGAAAAATHAAQMGSPPLGLSQRDGRPGGPGGAGGRSAAVPDLHSPRLSVADAGAADIEDSISAVIARACAGGGGAGAGRPHDPYDLPSDSDSDSDPGLTLKHTLLGRTKAPHGHTHPHTPVGAKHGGRGALTSTPLLPCSMDRSIDEVVRQAGKRGGGIASVSMVTTSDPDDLSSPPPSPPTPQPLLPALSGLSSWQQSMGMDEFSLAATGATEGIKKKKPKKEAKLKLKKMGKVKGHKEKDKGHEKVKSKDKKKDKKSKEKEAKLSWKEEASADGGRHDDPFSIAAAAAAAALSAAEEQRRDKDKHKERKKDKDKSKKDKSGKKDKGGKERARDGKKKKKMSAEEREREASLALFGPAACLLLPPSSSVTPTPAALADKTPLGADKPLKSKDKDKKKDKKEKKKKKDREKEKEREKERGKEKELEKEEKKKGKEKGGKAKEKAKELAKQEKVKAVEPPAVLSSPVIPRLTLRVGAGQDKIVISKVVPDSDSVAVAPAISLPPPVKTPGGRSGPGSRGRAPSTPAAAATAAVSLPPPLPPAPPPAPLTLPPHTPPTPPPALGSAKSGCSVVTETVSAYVVRDEWGNKIWICPGCNKPDDGSPMIGCDQCDDWYHWPCVGILTPPPEDQQWFCVKCAGKKTDKKQKKRRRKAN